jgi:toxin-antitoxin system PIN domain toxin
VIAIDTQILVYAHRRECPWHEPASRRVSELAGSQVAWAIPMHCLVEFYAAVTRPGMYRPPSTPAEALAQIDDWLSAPRARVLHENFQTWFVLRDLLDAARIAGPRAYDARIAAVCIQHGVTELWTADRDYLAYPALRVRNPLIDIPPTRAGEPRGTYRVKASGSSRRRARSPR